MNDRRQSEQIPWADYRAFLLRLWREGPEGRWRASLQDAASGKRYGFPNVTALSSFLSQETGEQEPQQGADDVDSDRATGPT